VSLYDRPVIESSKHRGLTICAASDASYEPGLRVALFSALEAARENVSIIVLDAGLRDSTAWPRMLGAHPRCAECRVVTANLDRAKSYPCQERFGPGSWLRLFLGELLADVDRVIYLDADVLVRDDLGMLWKESTDGAAIAAVRDYKIPTFASGLPHAVSALGVSGETPYYNAGVLLLDLDAWRRESLSQRALEYVRDHGDTIRFADQDAINAVAPGRIHELHPRWNVQVGAGNARSTIAGFPALDDPAADKPRASAAIVHFTGFKPWQPEGVRASAWSIRMHIEFARITARFSDTSRLNMIGSSALWGARLLRRIPTAIRRRIPPAPWSAV
jgi:lipopolysaccharide biosynthesis glycosyltransferase